MGNDNIDLLMTNLSPLFLNAIKLRVIQVIKFLRLRHKKYVRLVSGSGSTGVIFKIKNIFFLLRNIRNILLILLNDGPDVRKTAFNRRFKLRSSINFPRGHEARMKLS